MECSIRHSNSLPREKAQALSLEELRQLHPGDHIYIMGLCDCLLRVKVNGQPELWKRDPHWISISFKFGMYEHGYLSEQAPVYREITTGLS